jgi:hypothetical protein
MRLTIIVALAILGLTGCPRDRKAPPVSLRDDVGRVIRVTLAKSPQNTVDVDEGVVPILQEVIDSQHVVKPRRKGCVYGIVTIVGERKDATVWIFSEPKWLTIRDTYYSIKPDAWARLMAFMPQ